MKKLSDAFKILFGQDSSEKARKKLNKQVEAMQLDIRGMGTVEACEDCYYVYGYGKIKGTKFPANIPDGFFVYHTEDKSFDFIEDLDVNHDNYLKVFYEERKLDNKYVPLAYKYQFELVDIRPYPCTVLYNAAINAKPDHY